MGSPVSLGVSSGVEEGVSCSLASLEELETDAVSEDAWEGFCPVVAKVSEGALETSSCWELDTVSWEDGARVDLF